MRVVFLGTAGYHPNNRRHTTCVMIPEAGIVLDAGTGFFRVGDYLATDHLDIFLTHAHLDHIIGLTYLLSLERSHRLRQVRVFGQAEKISALERHLFAELLFPVRPNFESCPLSAETTIQLPKGPTVSWFELEHRGGAVGYRLDWQQTSLAFVTDTTADRSVTYLEKITGVDLLIHESYLPDSLEQTARQTGHSTPSQVAKLARQAQVKRLVLMHLNPLLEASNKEDPLEIATAKEIFPNLKVAEDLMEIELPD